MIWYLVLGFVAAAIALATGIWRVAGNYDRDDPLDVLLLPLGVLFAAVVVGALWPAAALWLVLHLLVITVARFRGNPLA